MASDPVVTGQQCTHDFMQLGNCQRCGEHYVAIIRGLQKALAQAQRRLADRRDIEKAKARLMDLEGLTEAEAFVRIRTRAMQERRTMGEVAGDILLTTPG